MCLAHQFIKQNINRQTVFLSISIQVRGFWLLFFPPYRMDILKVPVLLQLSLKSPIKKQKMLKMFLVSTTITFYYNTTLNCFNFVLNRDIVPRNET